MKNVLMFYDDAIIIDLVRIALEEKGINVVGFSDTKNLQLTVHEQQPIAVILDLTTALQLENEMVKTLKAKNIPTVIFSSNLNGKGHAEEIGFDYFVRKSPFGFDELEKLLDAELIKDAVAA